MAKFYTFALFFFILKVSFSQDLDLYRLSSGAAAYSVGFNPAQMADSRHKWMVSLGSFGVNTMNKQLYNRFIPSSKTKLKLSKDTFSTQKIDFQGPSVMVQLPRNNSFAISTHYRAGQVLEGDFDQLFNPVESNTDNQDLSGSYSSLGLKEIAFSYAHPYSFNEHFIKGGLTLKLVSAYQSIDLLSQNLRGSGDPRNSTFNGDVYGISTATNSPFKVGELLKSKNHGTGFDFGFIYEYRPKFLDYQYRMNCKEEYEPGTSKYLARFGISFIDIGKIKVPRGSVSKNFNNDTYANTSLSNDLTNNLQYLGLNAASIPESAGEVIDLPTRMILLAEVKLGKKGWHFGTVYKTASKKVNHGLNSGSLLALYPRFEQDGVEFSVPFIFHQATKKMGIGLHFRIASLIFGTESINSLFQSNAPAPTVYAGFNLAGLAKKIKDSDGDSVSDAKDVCPNVPGLWAFKGCPDTDGDGIKNSEDDCPEHAGPKETNGCPDTDGDGIFDKSDACPEVAGIARFNGCPDTDGDGLPDDEDDCPQKAGDEEFGGCPDSDGDGLIDSQDECPDLPGDKLFRGCPDTDGDGIPDKDDNCPEVKGSLENNGCPDSDGDGVIDQNDDCPEVTGVASLNGCPDSDNDGIKDSEDSCPNEPGSAATNGCPDSDGDGIINKEDLCPNISGVQNLKGCQLSTSFTSFEALSLEQNQSLTKISNELIQLDISDETIQELKAVNEGFEFPLTLKINGNMASEVENIIGFKLRSAGFDLQIEENQSEKNDFSFELDLEE